MSVTLAFSRRSSQTIWRAWKNHSAKKSKWCVSQLRRFWCYEFALILHWSIKAHVPEKKGKLSVATSLLLYTLPPTRIVQDLRQLCPKIIPVITNVIVVINIYFFHQTLSFFLSNIIKTQQKNTKNFCLKDFTMEENTQTITKLWH